MSPFDYVIIAMFILLFLIPTVRIVLRWFQSQVRPPLFNYPNLMGSSYQSRAPQEPMIAIHNPNKCSVRIRILSENGDTNELVSVERNGFGRVSVRSGQYYIRYKFDDSQQVYEGGRFPVEYGSAAMITLKYTPGGNYRTWPVDGTL